LHFYDLSIMIFHIARFCDVQNKSSTTVIFLIKYGKKMYA